MRKETKYDKEVRKINRIVAVEVVLVHAFMIFLGGSRIR